MITLSCSGSQTDVSRGDTLPRRGRERETVREEEEEEEEVKFYPGTPATHTHTHHRPRAKSTEENKERQQLIVEGGVDACERVSAGCFLTV